MQRGRRQVVTALAGLFLLWVPPPAAAQRPDAEPSRLGYVDSVEVHQVSLEVQVTGRRGARVLDLTRDDFELFEDGRRMEISHFRGPAAPAEKSPPTPRTPAPEAPAAPMLDRVAAPRHLLLFVDTLRLRPRDRRELFTRLRESLSREPGSARLMLAVYDGRLRVMHGFGAPTPTVLATLDGLERGRLAPQGERQRKADALAAAGAELEAADTPQELESARSLRDSEWADLQAFAESERHEILGTLGTLRQLVFSLGGLTGSKAILYAGDNLTMAPASDLFLASGIAFGGASPGGPASSGARRLDLYRHFESLVRQANASGVSLYTLTPPSHQHFGGAAVQQIGSPGSQAAIRSEREGRIKEAVCLMSQSTGGLCQSGGSDFGLLIDGTLADLGASYSLGYVPDRPADGEYHRIEVRLARRGLRARHRAGYIDRSPRDRLRGRLAATLWLAADEDPLGVELEIEQPRPLPGKGPYPVTVTVRVAVDRFALLPAAEPDRRVARGALLLVAARPSGRLTASEELPVALEVDARQLAAGAAPISAHRFELRLGRGRHKLAVGLWDEIARQGSFLGREIVVGGGEDG